MKTLPIHLEDHDIIDVLSVALEELRKLDPEMPMQTVMTFLTIARLDHDHPNGVQMKRLRELVGISQASMSRNTVSLGKGSTRPGHKLILVREDPKHRRRKLVRLSQRGRALMIAITTKVRDAIIDADRRNGDLLAREAENLKTEPS